jgi:hypothetical protein
MDTFDSSLYVFNTHVEADEAIRKLGKPGSIHPDVVGGIRRWNAGNT